MGGHAGLCLAAGFVPLVPPPPLPPPHPHPSGIQVGAASTGLPSCCRGHAGRLPGLRSRGLEDLPEGLAVRRCLGAPGAFPDEAAGGAPGSEASSVRVGRGQALVGEGGGAGLLSGRALPSSEVDMQFLTLFMWLLMVAAGALRARRERVSAAGARVREGIPPRRSIRAGDTRRRCQAGGQRCAPSQLYLSVCWCTATASPQQRVAAHSRRGRRLCDTAVPPPGLSLAEDVPDKAPPRGTLQ